MAVCWRFLAQWRALTQRDQVVVEALFNAAHQNVPREWSVGLDNVLKVHTAYGTNSSAGGLEGAWVEIIGTGN